MKNNFKSYYVSNVIRPVEEEPQFDNISDDWIKEHTAITKNGSIVIGVVRDKDGIAEWRHYIDVAILPQMFDTINESLQNNKEVTYFYSENLNEEKYIIHVLNMKYKDMIKFKILDKKIIREIQEVENLNNIAIITVSTPVVYALKFLIESVCK
jgi:hypothetical protein